jgi:putative RecB family exonuclease
VDPVRAAVASPGTGLPARLSASQINTYRSCALRYYFETILGWRQAETNWTTTGTLVHDTAESLYRRPPADRGLPLALELLTMSARSLFAKPEYQHHARDRAIRELAVTAVENLFRLEEPTAVTVTGDDLESGVDVELAGVRFTGRLDRRTRTPVSRIGDYKSGKRPPPQLLESKLTQLYLYAAAAEAAGDPAEEVELLFLAGEPAIVRRPAYPAALDDAVAVLAAMRSESEQDLAAEQFTATPGPLCKFCPFRVVCPTQKADSPVPGSSQSDARLLAAGLSRRGQQLASVEVSNRDLDLEDPW